MPSTIDNSDKLSEVRRALVELRDDGETIASIDGLIGYIDLLDKVPLPYEARLEQYKMQFHADLAQWEARNKAAATMLNAAIGFAHSALRIIILINGGAAVAVMGLIGSIAQKTQVPNALAWGAALFGVGVFLGGLCAADSYFAQYAYSHFEEKRGDRWRIAAILTGLGSMVLFLVGLILVIFGFSAITPVP